MESHWIMKEFGGIDFGDHRLTNRFLRTAYCMSENLGSSVNTACGSWSEAKGAYRMFDNEKVTNKEIFFSHQDQTLRRASQCKSTMLVIQDTSFLNFQEQTSTEGLGHIGTVNKRHSQGLVMHSALAFDPEREIAMGLIDLNIWSRKKEPHKKTDKERKHLPIEQKESMKWLNSLRVTQEVLSDLDKRVVTIADRESDVFEFMQEANRLEQNFVIRAVRNRKIILEDGSYSLIWENLLKQQVCGKLKVKVPARAGQKVRMAELEVRYCRLLIKPTAERTTVRKAAPIAVYGVMAKEINPPKSGGLEWMLLTDMSVESFNDAVEKISWYKCRWQIEIFHKVLKSVCRVEESQLRSADQLKKFVTLCSVNAWRLLWMTKVARTRPDLSCAEILEEHEWKILQKLNAKSNTTPPTVQEAVLWIAKIGGFMGRKNDGDPGIITLSRGWIQFKNFVNLSLKASII